MPLCLAGFLSGCYNTTGITLHCWQHVVVIIPFGVLLQVYKGDARGRVVLEGEAL